MEEIEKQGYEETNVILDFCKDVEKEIMSRGYLVTSSYEFQSAIEKKISWEIVHNSLFEKLSSGCWKSECINIANWALYRVPKLANGKMVILLERVDKQKLKVKMDKLRIVYGSVGFNYKPEKWDNLLCNANDRYKKALHENGITNMQIFENIKDNELLELNGFGPKALLQLRSSRIALAYKK